MPIFNEEGFQPNTTVVRRANGDISDGYIYALLFDDSEETGERSLWRVNVEEAKKIRDALDTLLKEDGH